MSGAVAVKYIHVEVWTNMALKRALRLLERVEQHMIGDDVPAVESVRGELRDLIARRRIERVGTGSAAARQWKRAQELTEIERRRKRIIKRGSRRYAETSNLSRP